MILQRTMFLQVKGLLTLISQALMADQHYYLIIIDVYFCCSQAQRTIFPQKVLV